MGQISSSVQTQKPTIQTKVQKFMWVDPVVNSVCHVAKTSPLILFFSKRCDIIETSLINLNESENVRKLEIVGRNYIKIFLIVYFIFPVI